MPKYSATLCNALNPLFMQTVLFYFFYIRLVLKANVFANSFSKMKCVHCTFKNNNTLTQINYNF